MDEGFPLINFSQGICKGWLVGKHPEWKYDVGKERRASSTTYWIHSDVSILITTTSMNGSRYFTTFIDYYSRFCWIYFLKKNPEFFETFKVFKALVEKIVMKDIKALRSNNGGKHIKREFQHICSFEEIQMQHYIPYTPQQNGVAERKNQSLKEKATWLLEARDLTPYI